MMLLIAITMMMGAPMHVTDDWYVMIFAIVDDDDCLNVDDNDYDIDDHNHNLDVESDK